MLNTNNLFEHNLDHYELGDAIASGSYSEVKKAFHLPTSTDVAMKIINKINDEYEDPGQILDEINNEIEIHSSLKQRNIIKILGKITTTEETILVLEYAEAD